MGAHIPTVHLEDCPEPPAYWPEIVILYLAWPLPSNPQGSSTFLSHLLGPADSTDFLSDTHDVDPTACLRFF